MSYGSTGMSLLILVNVLLFGGIRFGTASGLLLNPLDGIFIVLNNWVF